MRAVPVEMVFGHIEQDADGCAQRGCEIDLIRRHFEHVHTLGAERLQRQHRHADIAAHLRVEAGAFDKMRGERRRGRFPVGAGDRDQRTMQRPTLRARGRTVRCRRLLRRRHCCANCTVQCGSGCVSGTPGASTSAAMPTNRPLSDLYGQPRGLCVGEHLLAVVEDHDLGAAFDQRAGRRAARICPGRKWRPSCRQRQ